MAFAKDYGFEEGEIIAADAMPAEGNVSLGNLSDDEILTMPGSLLEEEMGNFSSNVTATTYDPTTFPKAFRNARTVLDSIGIKRMADSQDIQVGVNFKGSPIYSNGMLANDPDTEKGSSVSEITGLSLGAMGAFKDTKEASRFLGISNKARDPSFITGLDNAKSANDPGKFIALMSPDNRQLTDFTSYKLYENWNNLSPAQKSMGVAGTNMQGFTFDDGKTFETKKITPEIPNTPALNAAQGLSFAARGVNVAPATRKWGQYSTIQDAMFQPKNGDDTVNTAATLGILGFGMEGKAVDIDEVKAQQQKMSPMPHYGIGAVGIPLGQGLPQGYVALRTMGNQNIIIPQANAASSVIQAPDVANRSSQGIYKGWKKENVKQSQGVLGGSALAGGLSQMANTNPYTLGAVMSVSTLANVPYDQDTTPTQHISCMAGVTLNRLVAGNTDKGTDLSGTELMTDAEFTPRTFDRTMKDLRSEYAKKGISSKEIAYQLVNQGYAEQRFDDSQATSMHKIIDMVFDGNGYQLAQKVITGKDKGRQILEKRRG